ncbi:hypothetical protein [Streptomyces alkaliphilus]|uniref:hypothetical protein n=1 Tax=Streptomyces alkaliphilus TaxID=1472722 RepID=UPI001E51B9F8|nr:hypothetical protein [Streptomyces alkaliphilus]
MATIQSAAEIQPLLEPLTGQKIAALQVLGINSLKTLSPPLEALAEEVVTAADVVDRTPPRVDTTSHVISFDLQRTGRVVLLESAEPYRFVAGAKSPYRPSSDGGWVGPGLDRTGQDQADHGDDRDQARLTPAAPK